MLVWSQGWEDPLEEGMVTHSSILAWRIPWTEEPGGYNPRSPKEWGVTEETQHSTAHAMLTEKEQQSLCCFQAVLTYAPFSWWLKWFRIRMWTVQKGCVQSGIPWHAYEAIMETHLMCFVLF